MLCYFNLAHYISLHNKNAELKKDFVYIKIGYYDRNSIQKIILM